jgi:hypothetical protein
MMDNELTVDEWRAIAAALYVALSSTRNTLPTIRFADAAKKAYREAARR